MSPRILQTSLLLTLGALACGPQASERLAERSAEPVPERPAAPASPVHLPSNVGEANGLRLSAFLTEEPDGRRLHLELENLSDVEVGIFDPLDGPAAIWDERGFVLEKRSSNEEWRRRGLDEGCVRSLPESLLRLKRGEVWKSVTPLADLQQSWDRAQAPLEWPDAHLGPDNVLALIELRRVRVRVFAPSKLSRPGYGPAGIFPTELADSAMPSVEVEVPLARPLYVLPPEPGPVLGSPRACSCYAGDNPRPVRRKRGSAPPSTEREVRNALSSNEEDWALERQRSGR